MVATPKNVSYVSCSDYCKSSVQVLHNIKQVYLTVLNHLTEKFYWVNLHHKFSNKEQKTELYFFQFPSNLEKKIRYFDVVTASRNSTKSISDIRSFISKI